MEIWKDVVGFEGLYQVSNIGRVRSIDRDMVSTHSSGTTYVRHIKGKILTCEKEKHGDPYVLYYLKKDGKRFFCKAHRLVAISFLNQVGGKNFVNHKDCNPKNNHVENLEWVTHSENIKHAYENGKIDISKAVRASVLARHKRFIPVLQYNMNGQFIKRHESLSHAAKEIGSDVSAISKVCRKKYNHAKNYKFEYELL